MDPKANDGYVWMDGEYKKWKDATVHSLSHTLHYGFGAFEGLRLYTTPQGSAIFRLNDHTDRLFNSAHIMQIKIPFSREELNAAQIEIVKRNELTAAYIRPLVYYGEESIGLYVTNYKPHVLIAAKFLGAYYDLQEKDKGITLQTSSYIRSPSNSIMIKAKACGNYVNSILALQDAKLAGFNDALLLDNKGCVAETSSANIFIVKNNVIYTPNTLSILEGITRDTVIILANELGYKVVEKDLTKDNIYTADEMFITGTVAEITSVSEVDYRLIGNGKRGPITKKICHLYEETVQGKNKSHLDWVTYI